MNHRSSPPRAGTHSALSVLRRAIGTHASSAFRVSASLAFAVRFRRRPFRRFARATLRHFRRPAPGGLARLRRSGLLGRGSSDGAPASGIRQAPLPCGGVCHGSYSFSTPYPPISSEYEKRETSPPPFGGSKCHSSNRHRRSSVDDSNAFAASVTGRYANRTDWVWPSSP